MSRQFATLLTAIRLSSLLTGSLPRTISRPVSRSCWRFGACSLNCTKTAWWNKSNAGLIQCGPRLTPASKRRLNCGSSTDISRYGLLLGVLIFVLDFWVVFCHNHNAHEKRGFLFNPNKDKSAAFLLVRNAPALSCATSKEAAALFYGKDNNVVTRHDVICECGDSIDVHGTHGCRALRGCNCQMAPHHIAIDYAAALCAELADIKSY